MIDPDTRWGLTGVMQILDGPQAGRHLPVSGFFGASIAPGELYLPSTVRVTATGYAAREFTLTRSNGTPRNPTSTLLDFTIPMQFVESRGDTRVSRLPARRDEYVYDRFQTGAGGTIAVRTWWGDGDAYEGRELLIEMWCDGARVHQTAQRFGSMGGGFEVAVPREQGCEARLYPLRRTENTFYRIDLRYPR